MFDNLDGEYLKITYLEEEREEIILKCIHKLHLLMQIETRITIIHIGGKIVTRSFCVYSNLVIKIVKIAKRRDLAQMHLCAAQNISILRYDS